MSSDDDSRLQSQNGKGKGKNVKGKGKGDQEERVLPVIHQFTDYVDCRVLQELGAKLGAHITDFRMDGTDVDPRLKGAVSLSLLSAELLQRVECSGNIGIQALYKEEKLCRQLGIEGRLFSGVASSRDLGPMAKQNPWRTLLQKMPPFRATNSVFAYRRVLRQFLRGGLEGPCMDYDISTSFSRAFLDRHPSKQAIGSWVHSNSECVASCNLPRDVVKELVNAAPGIGGAGIGKWLEAHSLAELPHFLKLYLDEVRECMDLDLQRNPELVQKLKSLGITNQQAAL